MAAYQSSMYKWSYHNDALYVVNCSLLLLLLLHSNVLLRIGMLHKTLMVCGRCSQDLVFVRGGKIAPTKPLIDTF